MQTVLQKSLLAHQEMTMEATIKGAVWVLFLNPAPIITNLSFANAVANQNMTIEGRDS